MSSVCLRPHTVYGVGREFGMTSGALTLSLAALPCFFCVFLRCGCYLLVEWFEGVMSFSWFTAVDCVPDRV